jgi:hypothetical protein
MLVDPPEYSSGVCNENGVPEKYMFRLGVFPISCISTWSPGCVQNAVCIQPSRSRSTSRLFLQIDSALSETPTVRCNPISLFDFTSSGSRCVYSNNHLTIKLF